MKSLQINHFKQIISKSLDSLRRHTTSAAWLSMLVKCKLSSSKFHPSRSERALHVSTVMWWWCGSSTDLFCAFTSIAPAPSDGQTTVGLKPYLLERYALPCEDRSCFKKKLALGIFVLLFREKQKDVTYRSHVNLLSSAFTSIAFLTPSLGSVLTGIIHSPFSSLKRCFQGGPLARVLDQGIGNPQVDLKL